MTKELTRIGIDVHAMGRRQTGNETYIRNLVDALSALEPRGMALYLYHTLPSRDLDGARWRGELRRLRPHTPLVRIPFSFPIALKRDRIDVALFQYIAPPICPCKTVVMVHDISYELFPEHFNPIERARMKLLIPRSARAAARVLTVSEFSRREIAERYGIPHERIIVTYNGVSERFRPIADEAALKEVRRRLGLERPFILGVGNLQPRKNLERLIGAYAALRSSGRIPHDLVLVGQRGWRGASVLDAVARHGLGDSVKLTGYAAEAELVALYTLAELVVYPSLYEGFGLPVIEAMACGAPVVTSNVASLPEVAGDAALLVDPRREEEIADAMRRLIESASLRAQLRERGFERAKRFTWRRSAEQTAAVLREVA